MVLPLNILTHFADQWLPGPEVLYLITFGWIFLPWCCTFAFCTCVNFSHPQPPTAQRPTFYETSTSSSFLEQSSYESLLMIFKLMFTKNCHLPVIISMLLRTLQSPLFRQLFLRLLSPIWCCYILYSTSISSLPRQFCVLHMILKRDAPKGWESGPRTPCLPLCPFSSVTILKNAFTFFDYYSDKPKESTIDLINFICDKSGLIIYFYPLLTIFQPTHT